MAIGNRGYTDKTHLRGFGIPSFSLVHAPSGFGLRRSELYSPKTLPIDGLNTLL
ncbi:hypothetical protein ACSQ6I_10605 [Anabaena sp. WFMT]|uniref:hypothetical protein n=1 Tax=Anabaena sp. WFMT TaxID=3449730 RepID=UPI003F227DC9